MATKKEIKNELNIALTEIGVIEPWFDKSVNAWVFEHELYPVRYGGDSKQEVIENYPKYLEVFIEHRMQGRIDSVNEKKTKGKGGARPHAGRPVGTKKEPTKQIRVPYDIAFWLKQPGTIANLRNFIQTCKHA